MPWPGRSPQLPPQCQVKQNRTPFCSSDLYSYFTSRSFVCIICCLLCFIIFESCIFIDLLLVVYSPSPSLYCETLSTPYAEAEGRKVDVDDHGGEGGSSSPNGNSYTPSLSFSVTESPCIPFMNIFYLENPETELP